MKHPLISSIIISPLIIGIALLVAIYFIGRSNLVYIHPSIETVFLQEANDLIDQFDLKTRFTFRPSYPERNALAKALGIQEPLKDDEFLCCAVGSIIMEAYYSWPPAGGATGTTGQAITSKIEQGNNMLHVVRLRWPKNGFIVPMPGIIPKSRIEDFLKARGHGLKESQSIP